MKSKSWFVIAATIAAAQCAHCTALAAPPPPIHVQGRHFVDDRGNCVRMGGVMQSINSYFNDNEWGWGSDDHLIPRMLEYYDKTTKALTDRSQGCYANMVRLTDDGWWTQDDNLKPSKDAPHFYACDWSKYDRYVEKVLVPVTTNAVAHGLYVIIRPSYNTPGDTKVGDDYQKHLLKEWEHLAANKVLQKLAGRVLFELENEPIKIEPREGMPRESALAEYMQPMIDVIRAKGFKGPILAPGLYWQSNFEDYAKYPLRDDNLGYAVHAYPGWYDQNDDNADVEKFLARFRQLVPVADFAPIVVTEVDWSPIKPGKGKNNEFGQWVPENWGTWGTGSSSKWGRAYIGAIERLGNVSTLAGDARVLFEVKKYLETGKFELRFGGEKECCAAAFAQLFRKWANAPKRKAPKSATFRNPVILADCPDPSMCRAGDYVYMVTTTMHFMPGAPVMRSKDMVHWEIVSYIFDGIDSPEYSFEAENGKTGYGAGQWATSIVHHKGKFYAWFIVNDVGGFMYTADRPEGPWRLLSRGPYLHDGSLVFDDDGRVYVFHGSGHVTEMKEDLTGAKPGGLDRQLFERGEETALLEGSAAFKKDGYYYLMMVSCFLPNHPRREVCYRSKSLDGEWEKKVILETEFENWGGVGQGCVVECPDGKWRAMVFQDRGGLGRIPCLMGVTWKDGWPILGNREGKIPSDFTKPYPSLSGIVGSDGFKKKTLDLRWQWNHNPLDGAWSLVERPGWMRLKAQKVAPNIFLARNTLTQRMIGPQCEGEIRMDVSRMKDGDRAGLAAFQSDSAVLAVVCEDGRKRLVMSEEKSVFEEGRRNPRAEVSEKESVALSSDIVYLRIRTDFRPGQDWAEMDWSPDRKTWCRIGTRFPLRFDWTRMFVGSRFAIFCYPTKSPGGYVDVDYFRFSCEGHEK